MRFYILGGGPSFLDVTEDEWDFLKDKNTIQFARVPYGSRKTKYYLSIERVEADKAMIKYMDYLKWHDINLLLLNIESIKYAKGLGFKNVKKIHKGNFYFMPSRSPWFVDEKEPPHSYYETRAKHLRQPLFRFRGQLSAVINASVILGATDIRLIGVDMNDQWNFYENYDTLRKVCKSKESINEFISYMDEKKQKDRLASKTDLNPEYDPKVMHTTNMIMYEKWKYGDKGIRGMGDVLEWTNKELIDEGMKGISVCSKKSLLYKEGKLPYKGIIDD